ncbi:MAG TPA: response regulator, partial [Ramlibacter sp.]|nr:response regulator [Ramlibacter sp.]
IRTVQRDGFVDTSVTDNGRGLAASQLESIFELFFQGDHSEAPHESGLGIGLTLARSLAERHGGTISAHSPGPGLGSTFVFRMPAGEGRGQVDKQPSGTEALPKGQRIMVVDDNRDSADSTMSILRALGHDVVSAYDGPSALELARRLRPDVVLLDLAMPGADGFETLKLLRVQPGMYKSFVIAMTGYGAEEDKQRTRDAGFDAHLVKPIELDSLMRLLYQGSAPAG